MARRAVLVRPDLERWYRVAEGHSVIHPPFLLSPCTTHQLCPASQVPAVDLAMFENEWETRQDLTAEKTESDSYDFEPYTILHFVELSTGLTTL